MLNSSTTRIGTGRVFTAALTALTLLLSSLTLAASPALATNVAFTEGDYTYLYRSDTDDVAITGCNGGISNCPSAVVIPDTVMYSASSKNVVRIESSAFAFAGSVISSVSIGNNVSEIGRNAFALSTSVTAVEIPASVTSMDGSAFWESGVQAFTVNAGNPSYVATDGVIFNTASTSLIAYPAGKPPTNYVVPDGVETIGPSAFARASLSSLTLPSTVTWIEFEAFAGATGLGALDLSSSLQMIGNYAFESTDLSLVSIPATVSYIGLSAFADIPAQNFTVDAGNNNYQSIDGVIFNKSGDTLVAYPGARPATTYSVPTSVTAIGTGSFSQAHNLQTMSFLKNVTTIEDFAFQSADGLRSITFGPKLAAIGLAAFQSAGPLTQIRFQGPKPTFGMAAFANSGTGPIQYLYNQSGWKGSAPINGHSVVPYGAPLPVKPKPQSLILKLPAKLKRAKKYQLPAKTVQGVRVKWKLTGKKYCTIKGLKLRCTKPTRKKSFTMVATAGATKTYKAFVSTYKRKVK